MIYIIYIDIRHQPTCILRYPKLYLLAATFAALYVLHSLRLFVSLFASLSVRPSVTQNVPKKQDLEKKSDLENVSILFSTFFFFLSFSYVTTEHGRSFDTYSHAFFVPTHHVPTEQGRSFIMYLHACCGEIHEPWTHQDTNDICKLIEILKSGSCCFNYLKAGYSNSKYKFCHTQEFEHFFIYRTR